MSTRMGFRPVCQFIVTSLGILSLFEGNVLEIFNNMFDISHVRMDVDVKLIEDILASEPGRRLVTCMALIQPITNSGLSSSAPFGPAWSVRFTPRK